MKKKVLAITVLSLAALLMTAGSAYAWHMGTMHAPPVKVSFDVSNTGTEHTIPPTLNQVWAKGESWLAYSSSQNISYGISRINELHGGGSGSIMLEHFNTFTWPNSYEYQITDDPGLTVSINRPSVQTTFFNLSGLGTEKWERNAWTYGCVDNIILHYKATAVGSVSPDEEWAFVHDPNLCP